MDLKKWAGNKLGGPKPPAPAPGGGPPGMHGGFPPHPGAGAPAAPAGPPPFANLPSSTLPPDQAQWAAVGQKTPERPDNPPNFVTDEASWEKAKAAVKKNWDSYDEPWAVVTHVYKAMTE